jgi:sugar lactone lactonase YvrE/peroxiredoxin
MTFAQTGNLDNRRIKAPDFLSVDAWLNTDGPLRLKDLRGQVVLLDFWTYCCINCMHVFSDLKYLEDKYHDRSFVVVGVHSGKFSQEKDPQNIRQAILRHNISHPVAVDSDYQVWNSYGVRAWPTLVLIDPQGYVVGLVSGEGHRAVLDKAIAKLLKEHGSKGTLAGPMKFKLERDAFKPGVLHFPGKVLADAAKARLFISDTNHHRVLVTDLMGKVQQVVGKGMEGLKDGTYNEAQFYQPQGLTLSADGKILYVADTENHALRAVDLIAQTVTTVAGTGKQSYDYRAAGSGRTTALSSPWDLFRVDERIYIAMAGTHQIWVYNLKSNRVSVFAGTGREDRIDGVNSRAAFAQPSGLSSDGKLLYVADSEISTIRVVELKGDGRTKTVAGSGGLFDFGRRDGRGAQARFQHPLGVALWGDRLLVADTFNNLIRSIALKTSEVTTWLGTGKPELGTESDIGLFEPGGLSVAGEMLYIADTNHHRILAVDIKSKRATVLKVDLLPRLSSGIGHR